MDTCDDIDGVVVERFESEEELLIGWAEFLGKLQPDIITGYNIFGFDDDYIMKRVTNITYGMSFHVITGLYLNQFVYQ